MSGAGTAPSCGSNRRNSDSDRRRRPQQLSRINTSSCGSAASLNFSRSSSEMDLITRRVIERLEGTEVTDEILQEYTDPESPKYEQMVEEIRKELNFTSLRFNRLDDMLDAVEIDRCKLCTYCWDGKE